MLQPAVLLTCMLQYFLNQTRRVKNGMALTHESWPDGTNSKKKDTTYRGGGLPERHFAFFKALAGTKRWYRVAHPLASSFETRLAREFEDQPDPSDPSKKLPKVLYIINLDPDGCLQGNYLEAHSAHAEKEWLFSAYSAFQVISAKDCNVDGASSADQGLRFVIELQACRDNKHISDNVPTAPWH